MPGRIPKITVLHRQQFHTRDRHIVDLHCKTLCQWEARLLGLCSNTNPSLRTVRWTRAGIRAKGKEIAGEKSGRVGGA